MDEYENRAGYYDHQLLQDVGVGPTGMTTREKIARLRQYREARYEQLLDAVYARRGWDENGIPTLQTLRRLGFDLDEVIALVQ